MQLWWLRWDTAKGFYRANAALFSFHSNCLFPDTEEDSVLFFFFNRQIRQVQRGCITVTDSEQRWFFVSFQILSDHEMFPFGIFNPAEILLRDGWRGKLEFRCCEVVQVDISLSYYIASNKGLLVTHVLRGRSIIKEVMLLYWTLWIIIKYSLFVEPRGRRGL